MRLLSKYLQNRLSLGGNSVPALPQAIKDGITCIILQVLAPNIIRSNLGQLTPEKILG